MSRPPKTRRLGKELRNGPENPRRPILTYLRGVLASLNPTEVLIAESVLRDPERIITSSIAEVSTACGASVGAIVGFCQSLGLKGFADFRIALARDLAQAGMPAGHSGACGSLFEKVFYVHAKSLTETLQMNPGRALEQAADVLRKARRIEVFSIGLSYPVAYTAYCKFTLLGLKASASFDAHLQLIAASQLEAGDLGFGISLSGSTRETAQCVEVSRANGATTMCLTNAVKSPITSHSDFCLYATPSEINYFQAPLASRVTQLAIIDALFVSLAMENKNRTATRLQRYGEELRKRRES